MVFDLGYFLVMLYFEDSKVYIWFSVDFICQNHIKCRQINLYLKWIKFSGEKHQQFHSCVFRKLLPDLARSLVITAIDPVFPTHKVRTRGYNGFHKVWRTDLDHHAPICVVINSTEHNILVQYMDVNLTFLFTCTCKYFNTGLFYTKVP